MQNFLTDANVFLVTLLFLRKLSPGNTKGYDMLAVFSDFAVCYVRCMEQR